MTMKLRNVPFSPPDMTEAEAAEVRDAILSGWITTGPRTKKLEKEVAEFVGVDKAVCLNSQTACGEMALRLLGVGEGDEVIVPAYTYTASASIVEHVGAKLVFVDVQKDCLEMDYEAVEAAISPKTKAIIPVDLAGIPCDYDRLFAIVERKKNLFTPKTDLQKKLGRIAICCDAAHAFGASRKEKMVGAIADFSSGFSYPKSMKRLFDIVASGCGLIVLSPLFLILAIWIKFDSKGPVFYRQVRVGRGNKDFRIFKFRSMRVGADKGSLVTIGGRDPRVTCSGYYIRKYKFDELPQLINVFIGDMSLVGPRPEVRHYVNYWTPEQMHVLDVRPGITDPASIKFRNENELMEKAEDPEDYYIHVIMQEKIKLYLEYVKNSSFWYDIKLIFETFKVIVTER